MDESGIYEKFGRSVTIHCGNTTTATKAFINPLRYKNKMYLYGTNTEIGYNSMGYYYYISKTGDLTGLSGSDYIECGGKKYKVDKAEKVYKGEAVFYYWATIREMQEVT